MRFWAFVGIEIVIIATVVVLILVGEVKRRMFDKMYLFPEYDSIILETRCKKCGNKYRKFVDFETV